jgi:hypothetical protein
VPLIQGGRNLPEGSCALGFEVRNYRPDVSRPPLGLGLPDQNTCLYSLPHHEVDLASVPAELLPTSFGKGEDNLSQRPDVLSYKAVRRVAQPFTILNTASAVKGFPVLVRNPAEAMAPDTS